MKVILDCNIYDCLSRSPETVSLIQSQVRALRLSVMCTPSLWREIVASPHADIAKSLPVAFIGESVFRANGQVGDRVGSGRLYTEHYGTSSKFNDALIADAAEHDADYLVTEDARLRKRMNDLARRGRAVAYSEFKDLLHTYAGT